MTVIREIPIRDEVYNKTAAQILAEGLKFPDLKKPEMPTAKKLIPGHTYSIRNEYYLLTEDETCVDDLGIQKRYSLYSMKTGRRFAGRFETLEQLRDSIKEPIYDFEETMGNLYQSITETTDPDIAEVLRKHLDEVV